MPSYLYFPKPVLAEGLFEESASFPALSISLDEFGALTSVEFERGTLPDFPPIEPHHPVAIQFDEYFSGKRRSFEVTLKPRGTEFQKAVWASLCRIPYGESRSYSDIAMEIGNPAAVRAVGAANGANPIVIIQPCHRVIGRSGKLVGFGGGIDNKAILLTLEGCAFSAR